MDKLAVDENQSPMGEFLEYTIFTKIIHAYPMNLWTLSQLGLQFSFFVKINFERHFELLHISFNTSYNNSAKSLW